jgi:hypothetical protein
MYFFTEALCQQDKLSQNEKVFPVDGRDSKTYDKLKKANSF